MFYSNSNLNDKFIKSLPLPKNKLKVYWDSMVIGLGIRITNYGTKSFILRYVNNGRERTFTLGGYPTLSCSAARNIAIKLKGKIINGFDPLDKKEIIRATPTFKDFSEDFLKFKEKVLRPSTLKSYRDFVLKTHVLPEFGKAKIDSITKRDIQAFHSSLSKVPSMANRVLRVLSSMLGVAVSWGLVESNQASGIKKFPEHKRERYLSDEELKKVHISINEEGGINPMNLNAIILILLTGSRKSEVLSARWQDFDLEKGIWHRPAMLNKQNKSTYTPLNSEALEIIKNMKEDIVLNSKIGNSEKIISTSEYLFFNPKTGTHLRDVKKSWGKICKKFEIKNARINDLRHTFASILASNGIGLEVIGKLIGHSNITTTQRYAHLFTNPLKLATDILGSKVIKKD